MALLRLFFGRKVAAGAVTYQYARPSSDVTDGSWTNELGSNTNLYASVDEETPDHADYIQSEADPTNSSCVLGLAPKADPGVHTDHYLKYFARREGDADLVLRVELLQGETPVASWSHSGLATTETEFDRLLTEEQAAAITDYGALRVRLTANPT